MSGMPSLETLAGMAAISGKSVQIGQPLSWWEYPGEVRPPPCPPGWPLHGAAILPRGGVIVHRHPHLFLVELGEATWCLAGALPRSGGYVRRGKLAGVTPVAGPVTLSWGKARRSICDAVRRAAAGRAGADPKPGEPDSYALPHANHRAAWVRWTGQDEARYLARHAIPCASNLKDEPMHRLEPEIARDALEVEASRAAAAVLHWVSQRSHTGGSGYEANADALARTACARLEAAASRLRAAGGSPGSVLAGVAATYRRMDPTGYIGHRLAFDAGVEITATIEGAA